MKVKFTITCPTKFHADHVADALYRKGMLEKVITGLPKKYFYNRHNIPFNKITNTFSIMAIPLLFNKITGGRLKFINKWLDIIFLIIYDLITSLLIKPNHYAMIWRWAGLFTIKRANKKNVITLVQQSGSASLHRNKTLEEEYNKLGLNI
jgi:hypothetical protein